MPKGETELYSIKGMVPEEWTPFSSARASLSAGNPTLNNTPIICSIFSDLVNRIGENEFLTDRSARVTNSSSSCGIACGWASLRFPGQLRNKALLTIMAANCFEFYVPPGEGIVGKV